MLDWEQIYSAVQPYATFVAGILFGTGWWVWADAVVYSAAVLHHGFTFSVLVPGLVATLAVAMMNCVGREDLEESYNDDASMVRSKLLLFLSYLVSLGAFGAAVALLIGLKQHSEDLWVGASAIIQCVLVLAAGMICWFFHASPDSGAYSMI